MVSKGELGELTGRLLLILAMDSAQEAVQSEEIARGIGPRWSKPVGVIDFMKSLFGDKTITSTSKIVSQTIAVERPLMTDSNILSFASRILHRLTMTVG